MIQYRCLLLSSVGTQVAKGCEVDQRWYDNVPNNGSRMYHNFVANVITLDVKTVTVRRDRNSNNQLSCGLLVAIVHPYRTTLILFNQHTC